MPAAGMRRSTRVFGTRVLRSGRRLCTEPRRVYGKYIRQVNRDHDWIELLEEGGGNGGYPCKDDAWGKIENENDAVDMKVCRVEEPVQEAVVKEDVKDLDRRWGIVYRRKRKRMESEGTEQKRFGKTYVRRQWRKRCKPAEELKGSDGRCRELAIVGSGPFVHGYSWIVCFLNSVLEYMSRVRIRLSELCGFLLSEPICDAYSSHGILFRKDCISIRNRGVCVISGSRSLIPMFSVDFSAVPFCFMQLHLQMHLKSMRLACVFMNHSLNVIPKGGQVVNDKELYKECSPDAISAKDFHFSELVECEIHSEREDESCSEMVPVSDDLWRVETSHTSSGFPKPALRMQLRTGRSVQKRRTSLRRKRGRPPSIFRTQKLNNGALTSDFLKFRSGNIQSSRSLRSSVKKSSASTIKDLKMKSCSANILIVEKDKCLREEGAIVTLESSSSKQWSLTVMKDGVTQYSFIAQKVMKPPCCNRFTHAMIWAGDSNGWKLEFPNRLDWLIFKELYKECSDRNVLVSPASNAIPVPEVHEVVYADIDSNSRMPFVRPVEYITVKDDELARALAKRTPNYDMDSDDEEWLNKFNEEKGANGIVTTESFESIIDALEKVHHGNPNNEYVEDLSVFFPMNMERGEVVEAVRHYWTGKRTQKQSALVRIFQLYQQPRRSQVIPKSVLRKKRSFKRQGSQAGRGKQRTFLQAMVAENDVLEQQNNLIKVQEAKAAAERSEEFAILKRQRAQLLMANADLATYKAMVALRIAEAAELAEASSSTVASVLL